MGGISSQKEDAYAFYNKEYLSWKRVFEKFLKKASSFELILFIQKKVSGSYKEKVVFRSDDLKEIEYIGNVIKDSARSKWVLEQGKEVRVAVPKMAAGKIIFGDGATSQSIYINFNAFQERSTGFYLEFMNPKLKEWADSKVKKWSEKNPNVRAYDTETGEVLNIFKWYKMNTRFH